MFSLYLLWARNILQNTGCDGPLNISKGTVSPALKLSRHAMLRLIQQPDFVQSINGWNFSDQPPLQQLECGDFAFDEGLLTPDHLVLDY